MNRGVKLAFALVAVAALAGTLGYRLHACCELRAQAGWRLIEPEPIEGQLPEIGLQDQDGDTRRLDRWRGKSLVLNFWATWCEPCKRELPHLARLAEALADGQARVLLVSVDQSWTDVARQAGQLQEAADADPAWGRAAAMLRGELPNVEILRDPGEKLARALGTTRYPETYLVGSDGRLRYRCVGPKAWGRAEAIAFMQRVLKP
ncbi:MAG: TlpA family protein disulfide reductase [Deltaproteobacteria bacterium]|nr:TlpA family protein disulfide reductase [Deltaproteobacteria bacterium]